MKIPGISLIMLLAASQITMAASTEWLEVQQFKNEIRKMQRTKLIPESILCKAREENKRSPANILLKVEYQQNTRNIKWISAFGDDIDGVNSKLAKKGYFPVSLASFLQTTYHRVKCAVWYNKKSGSLSSSILK